jgi:hypothetical protein
MQPRLLMLALVVACFGTADRFPSTGPRASHAAAATYECSTSPPIGASQLACFSLEDDAADDLRFSDWHLPAIANSIQPVDCATLLCTFVPTLACHETLQSQHIVLQV